ncbi:MAG: hypothetical protein GEV03_01825 [Streptosporangiales bacterium]|nr:hypothetical protein [Streptosporangiales bacterium]
MSAGVDPEDVSATAQRLARAAMSLARAGSDPTGAATVLMGLGGSDKEAVRLARARCLAASDQDPGDWAARNAGEFLDTLLRRLES